MFVSNHHRLRRIRRPRRPRRPSRKHQPRKLFRKNAKQTKVECRMSDVECRAAAERLVDITQRTREAEQQRFDWKFLASVVQRLECRLFAIIEMGKRRTSSGNAGRLLPQPSPRRSPPKKSNLFLFCFRLSGFRRGAMNQ